MSCKHPKSRAPWSPSSHIDLQTVRPSPRRDLLFRRQCRLNAVEMTRTANQPIDTSLRSVPFRTGATFRVLPEKLPLGELQQCGIVGYIGPKGFPVIIEGLRKLEYRGYDSRESRWSTPPAKWRSPRPGKLRNLERPSRSAAGRHLCTATRAGHARRPTEENAHPHRDCTGQYVVVHNGIVEKLPWS